MKKTSLLTLAILLSVLTLQAREKWTAEQAKAWYAKQPYLAGANYIPASAVNQIEMWNADTFDPEGIDKELALAQTLGFNTLRVFLHDIVWKGDPEGFYNRLDQFLDLCQKHHIRPMIVFFDSVWNPDPKPGKQPAPTPYVHNSQWVQSPAMSAVLDTAQWPRLKQYVTDTIARYKDDPRVLAWDLYNEPGNLNRNPNFRDETAKIPAQERLLKAVFQWARSADPSQPVTVCVWKSSSFPFDFSKKPAEPMEQTAIDESDVISYHCYIDDKHPEVIRNLSIYGRPMMCTEYMARPRSTFDPALGLMKQHGIAAYNWGFVDGKTQTIVPWDSWKKKYSKENPPSPLHEIFYADGTPIDPQEVAYIKKTLKGE